MKGEKMKNSLIMLLVVFSLSNIAEATPRHIIMVKKVISTHASPKKVMSKKLSPNKSGRKHHISISKVHNGGVTGIASYYGNAFNGHKTSSGEIFDSHKMTAAHKTFPMNSLIKVKNLKNDKTVIVRINDRGPWIKSRMLDLSKSAAVAIGLDGIGKVSVTLIN